MSSVYSSGSSRRPSRISLASTLGSKNRDSAFEKLHDKLDFDPSSFDLEKYKTELQHSEPDLRRLRSLSSKEAADVIAATRFKLELERLEQLSEYEDECSAPVNAVAGSLPLRSTSLPRPRPSDFPEPEQITQQEARQLKRRKTPEPIVVLALETPPQETQSARLPPRTASRPRLNAGEDDQAVVKSHRRHVTISEGRGPAKNMIMFYSPSGNLSEGIPPLPALSPSSSIATPKVGEMPLTPLSLCPPNEDQIRREIEQFTLHDGAEPLIGHKYRGRPPPHLQLDSDGEEDEEGIQSVSTSSSTAVMRDDDQGSIASVTPSVRRRKGLFSIFERKSELDKLLDLYLTDDPVQEVQPAKRKPSLARRMTMSRRRKALRDVPAVPPLPQTFPPEGMRPG